MKKHSYFKYNPSTNHLVLCKKTRREIAEEMEELKAKNKNQLWTVMIRDTLLPNAIEMARLNQADMYVIPKWEIRKVILVSTQPMAIPGNERSFTLEVPE